ncbi:DNA polymerase delta subunit 3 [Lingula anatina]|uniref:DNA polymerase delta subunit 3 n=1 Tax=Lingula anatina TaxID=7574 RepID=A0A1S3HVN9_LINAN|nr:DNA polymerase delta subunit 3 [Lingula anatina]|eukprot:XP_013390083.1 DNA polymerase delta subunit 3 [Lingula anatina]
MAVDQIYLENLDEFVNDENKVVTYKWLSRTLSVHVNQAKQMLYTFVQQQRNKKDNDKLSVCYFLSGMAETPDGGKILKAMVVPEESLDTMKSTLTTVTSCHVYSVQKVKLKDSNALYIADYDKLKGSLLQSKEFSAIRSDECKPRSLEELEKLEAASHPVITEPPAKVTTMNGTSGSKPKPKQPTGIAGMFSNASKKKEDKEENEKEEGKGDQEQKETVADKGKGKQGGIGSFFSKQQNKEPSTKSETTKVEPSVKKDSADAVKPQRDLNKKSPPKRGQKSKKTRKQDSDEEDAAPQKQKRRRIQVVESSSEEEEEDEVIPESPVPSPVADIPSSPEPEKMEEEEEEEKVEKVKKTGNSHAQSSNQHESSEKHRVKRRKKVTNTYMDKQGFMVTEEVWETASTDASDIDEPTKPAPVTAPKSKQDSSDKSGNKDKKVQPTKKKTSPDPKHSGKQTSLMSFFKKK